MKDRTYYRSRKSLMDNGLVENKTDGTASYYRLTERGFKTITAMSANVCQ